jgi:hypothetical protein
MSDKSTYLIDPDNSLADAWERLSDCLRQTGAREYQIDAMEMTFFVGALQTYAICMGNARGSREEFNDAMAGIRRDIDDVMPSDVEGVNFRRARVQ